MFFFLLAAFILLPIIELIVLLKIGGMIGAFATIGLIAITGIVGAQLARYEGMGVINRIHARTQMGELPAEELWHGALIFAAGLLLITPGFLTDGVGFALLSGTFRNLVAGVLKQRFKNHIHTKTSSSQQSHQNSQRSGEFGSRENRYEDNGPVIDVEGKPVDEDKDKK